MPKLFSKTINEKINEIIDAADSFKLISRNWNYIPCIDFSIDLDELDLTNSA